MDFPPDINPAVGEADFFTHLVMNIPPGRDKMGRDELGTNVALAEGFLVHTVIFKKVSSGGDSIQTRDKNLVSSTTTKLHDQSVIMLEPGRTHPPPMKPPETACYIESHSARR